MNRTIHRGTRQIGGSCFKLESGGTRILVDAGLPMLKSISSGLALTECCQPENLRGSPAGAELRYPLFRNVLLAA